MNCPDIRQRIRDAMQQDRPMGHDETVFQHLHHCELCRSAYNDAMLVQALREMPVPELPDDFAARAIRSAVRKNRVQRIRSFISISAAALLIIVAGGVFLRGYPDFFRHPAPLSDNGIVTANGIEQTVRVMIEAMESRQNATLAIDLGDNIALKNFPGYRQLTWQTDLTRGRNLLELPLVLQDDADGYVDIRYRYNGKEQAVRIPVRAAKTNETGKIINGQDYS